MRRKREDEEEDMRRRLDLGGLVRVLLEHLHGEPGVHGQPVEGQASLR